MKNFFLLLSLCLLAFSCQKKITVALDPIVLKTSKTIIKINGQEFRDLNNNGKLDTYEDPTASIDDRIQDLLSQMTLEEKAGIMFINGAPVSEDGNPNQPGSGPTARMTTTPVALDSLKMNHFNIWSIPDDPAVFAKWYNKVQLIAEKNQAGDSCNNCI